MKCERGNTSPIHRPVAFAMMRGKKELDAMRLMSAGMGESQTKIEEKTPKLKRRFSCCIMIMSKWFYE